MIPVCRLLLAALLGAAGPALAQSDAPPSDTAACPPVAVDAEARDSLHAALAGAESPAAAQPIQGQLWELWLTAPDGDAQDLLDSGLERMRMGDLEMADRAFTALVDYCPDYAEGYNQRAFAHFLRDEFAPALEDLDRALALEPRHIGALSGRALTLVGLGRDAEALEALETAVALNPWLNERAMMPELRRRLGVSDL